MVRAAVLAIVVTLSGAPAVGVFCALVCEAATASAMTDGHHHHGAAQAGFSVTAVHVCDPNVAGDPFIPPADTKDRLQQVGVVSQPIPETPAPGQSILEELWLASIDVGDPVHRPPSVLRI